ncbi:hypothetical protein [Nonomuraea dietziae]
MLPLPNGGHRLFYEARLPDDSHELRTELVTHAPRDPPSLDGTSTAPRP